MQKVADHLLELFPDRLGAAALITHQLQKQFVLLVQELASVRYSETRNNTVKHKC